MNSYYKKNVKEDIDIYIKLNPFFNEWFEIVKPILINEEFQKRKLFPHHHNLSVWQHSILVSFKSYMSARYFNADERICAIAGLLHDFYENAWLYNEELKQLENGKYLKDINVKKTFFQKHGFTHAKSAAKNYIKYFPELENKKITNSIKRHMFPLNIIPPRYKEGLIITCIDKINSCSELPSLKNIFKISVAKIKNIVKKV